VTHEREARVPITNYRTQVTKWQLINTLTSAKLNRGLYATTSHVPHQKQSFHFKDNEGYGNALPGQGNSWV
jgi:hypothetical protein